MDLNSELHRRRLFYSDRDRPAFQPHEQAMFTARYYQVLEACRPADRCLLIVDPVCDFDFVADRFLPFLDRVFMVLGLVYVKVVQGDRCWMFEASFELEAFGWYQSEGDRVENSSCSFLII